ncbi:MAG: hypothetical protein ACK5OB_21490, partial [Pirellula sp.]
MHPAFAQRHATYPSHRSVAWLPIVACMLLSIGQVGRTQDILVDPPAVTLNGPFAQTQLVVRDASSQPPGGAIASNPTSADRTSTATYTSSDPNIVHLDATGCVSPKRDGQASIRIDIGGRTAIVDVQVSGMSSESRVDFHRDILPLMTRAGCNAGACHASQYGKGGFVLSVM